MTDYLNFTWSLYHNWLRNWPRPTLYVCSVTIEHVSTHSLLQPLPSPDSPPIIPDQYWRSPPPWYPLSGVSISASLVIRQLQLQGTSGDTGQIMGVWWVWLHSCSADQPSNTWSYSSRLSSDWANCVKQWFTFVYDNCPNYLKI